MNAAEWVGITAGGLALVLAVRDTLRTHYQSKNIKAAFDAAYQAFVANNEVTLALTNDIKSVHAQVKTLDARIVDSQREHGNIAAAVNSIAAEVVSQRPAFEKLDFATSAMLAPKKRGPRKVNEESGT